MKLTRNPDGYLVRIPEDVVAALGLREGDNVDVSRSSVMTIPVSDDDRARAMDTIRSLQRPLLPGYRFDRDEANAR